MYGLADLVISGGTVYTVNEALPRAQAVAVRDGEIIFVGDDVEVQKYISEDTEVIDLEGKMLLPGFIDTHNHVFEGVFTAGNECDLLSDKHLKKQIPYLKECKARNPDPGTWITGYGHQFETLMGNDENTNPRQVLDTIFPDNPVVIMEESSHSMIVNSMALSLAGFDRESEHPVGGRLMYDAQGELNGVLFDNAGDIIMEMAWNSRKNPFEGNYLGLMGGMAEVVSYGITTVGDGRLYWRRGWYDVWQSARENNDLIIRAAQRPWIYPDIDMEEQLGFLGKVATDGIEGLLVLNQVKLYSDGILHFGTAKLLSPYDFSWQKNLPLGLNYIEENHLVEWLKRLDEVNLGAHIHALGDGGVREALNAIEVSRRNGSKQLYSMTHLEMVDDQDIPRFASLDVDADFQAGAGFFEYTDWATDYIGYGRSRTMMPMRDVYDTGANVTFSSDWTVNPLNPLVAIAQSVKLKKSKGLPDVHAAIKAATINGAKALGLDSITGSIEVGKSADFVVLKKDITDLSWRKIKKTRILTTILQGETVYHIDEP
ncbi:MAG: amidohydrolase family protein [Gammaproteobacteria bacterium]|nr:amidohydrolase family protein [Gammaproteobacteria bacterium]